MKPRCSNASGAGGPYVQTSPSARRFVVGFPRRDGGDFQYLLDWLDEAQLDRVGAFRFEPVEGAAANALPDQVPERSRKNATQRIMEKTAAISAAKLAAKVGLHTGRASSMKLMKMAARPGGQRPMRPKLMARFSCAMLARSIRETLSRC
jgi:hypothetical protein